MYTEEQFLDAQNLLAQLLACPSFSREEQGTAAIIQEFLAARNISFHTLGHNVWAKNLLFDAAKPTILLNSHHDTVKPNASWSYEPFAATIQDGKMFGLGSNDAGASLVCLISVFCAFFDRELPFNLVLAATAEEEISGKGGIESVLGSADFPVISWAIVGEPTDCQLAIAEKGLMVIDAEVKGLAGHAARNEGVNAIYLALEDISKIKAFEFPEVSKVLGPVKCTVSVINAGKQHNVVPDVCHYTIDCRVNECYSLEQVLEILRGLVQAELTPRSTRLQSSKIPDGHPVLAAATALGLKTFGSPTLSDQALMQFPSVKIGPGHSGRSHTADEFIYLEELKQGIQTYQNIVSQLI
ncbi:M20/M25/M40 family metallo-hydrolase [Aquirufa sp.]|jgi:acetylornithine deacetylase|uniref:M20/M25/M40 family metallo-hydrolase n=1 Tax=Aquirufa sp. TaxID=2676249 RepID=UPI0037C19564